VSLTERPGKPQPASYGDVPDRSPLFTGVGVALVTLFDDDRGVDASATAEHAARLVDLGVRAVVVAGSTGEADALDDDERARLLTAVRAAVPPSGEAKVLAGTGAPWARQAAARVAAARDGGADGVLVLSPRGTSDPRHYYDEVAAAAGDLPVLAYHFPKVSAPGIALDLLPDLPVAGCKDSSGDAERLLATLTSWDGWLYVGSAALLSYAGPLGATGAILALANAEPQLCAAAFTGDAGAQRSLAPAHLHAARSFPGGIKELTARRFATSTVSRLG
jgi:dihydrodipicolinate synthase/N-acetylneuraminate lyase